MKITTFKTDLIQEKTTWENKTSVQDDIFMNKKNQNISHHERGKNMVETIMQYKSALSCITSIHKNLVLSVAMETWYVCSSAVHNDTQSVLSSMKS